MNPTVPAGPETVKLRRSLPESKDNAETVEFEITEKTPWFDKDVDASVTVRLVSLKTEFPA